MNLLKFAFKISLIRRFFSSRFSVDKPSLKRHIFGLDFKNPVGLAAGFDKNAVYLRELEILGFGFVEIGTVTPIPQPGTGKPRLFRLKKDGALINRMGFNNDGVKVIAERLRKWNQSILYEGKSSPRLIVGGNIGKNKSTQNEDAWKDYESCFRELLDCVDYFVVNVSSPNTPRLRELQEKQSLRKILSHLQTINNQQPVPRPILLKIAPDLTVAQVDDIIEVAIETKLDGLVATNTTAERASLSEVSKKLSEKSGAGGLSGRPLSQRSTEIVRYIHQRTNGNIPVIGSGGIFTAADAKEKLTAGASLVQIWTGFIYEGPAIVKNICNGLQ